MSNYLEHYFIEGSKLPALSDEFADKMASLADLGVDSFSPVELDFLQAHPHAIEEDENLKVYSGLRISELEKSVRAQLYKIFQSRPSDKFRVFLKDAYYYIVTIKEEKSEKIQGFITFMGGGPIPQDEYKITVLAIDQDARQRGLATKLINSLEGFGVFPKKIVVCTRPSNTIAINAYKKWGFIEDKEAPPSHFIKGHWIHLARVEHGK